MRRRVFSLAAVLAAFVVFASLAVFFPQGTASGMNSGAGASSGNLQATDNQCGYTDETTSGPYYISGVPETDNLNYQKLPGEPMIIRGVVYDGSTGKPIANAQINVWHVDSTGKYWPAAAGDAANFDKKLLNLRGIVRTNDKGEYQVNSIKPAIYEGRRRHIHYYITAPGYVPLFTQTYWKDDPVVNDGVDQNTEPCRLLTFTNVEKGGTVGTFNIYLRPQTQPGTPTAIFAATMAATTAATVVPTAAATAVPTAAACASATQKFTLVDLNTATNDQLMAIPNMNSRMLREFLEYRPYISILQFRRELGKYISAEQVAAYEKYIYVPIKVDASDAATLKQIPSVDDKIAADLIAARPNASNEAFLEKLGKYLTPDQVAYAKHYLDESVK